MNDLCVALQGINPPPPLTFYSLGLYFLIILRELICRSGRGFCRILTGTYPNKAWGSNDASHVTPPEPSLLRAAMCLRCFRPWRLAGLPVDPNLTAHPPGDHPRRPAVTSGHPGFFHAPENAAQKRTRESRHRRVLLACTFTPLTKYGLPPCHIWECTSRRSLYKAGNPLPVELTEPKFMSRPPVTEHWPEVGACCCLLSPDDITFSALNTSVSCRSPEPGAWT